MFIAGNSCICLVCETKTFEETDYNIMQLVGYMIASAQENYTQRKTIFPPFEGMKNWDVLRKNECFGII